MYGVPAVQETIRTGIVVVGILVIGSLAVATLTGGGLAWVLGGAVAALGGREIVKEWKRRTKPPDD